MALIDKASLLMVPSTYEAGKLYNVLPSGNRAPDSTDQNSGYDQTRADFDFDRGSNASATRIGSDGLIKKYRENLLLQSNQFDTTWSIVNNGSLTSGQTGYDGSSDAWLYTRTGSSSRIQQVITKSGVNTFSIYAKAGALNWVWIRALDGIDNPNVFFDIQNGVQGIIGGSNYVDSSIEGIGGGWYRCKLVFSQGTTQVRIYPADGDGDVSGTSGNIYIQNAQLESGLVASSYLESTSVTGKAGVLVDLPRINYDANGENAALLLEPSRANLLPYSEWFGAWTLNGGGTGSNPVLDFGHTSPEGVDNAYKVTFDTGAGTTTSDESIMYISKSGLTIGNEYTASVYLKGAVGGEEVIVRDTTGGYVKWTLTNEWKRYEMTQAAAGSSYATSFGVRQGLGGIGTINSDAVVYMYGFQSEAGNYVSSYIPTMGTSQTRAADSGISNVDSLLTSNATYTWFVEFIVPDSGIGGGEITLKDSGGSSQLRIYCNQNNTIGLRVEDGGQTYLINVSVADTAKCLFQCSNGLVKGFYNGSLVHTFSIDTGMDAQKIHLGPPVSAPNVKQVMLFNEALTDAECVTLTTL